MCSSDLVWLCLCCGFDGCGGGDGGCCGYGLVVRCLIFFFSCGFGGYGGGDGGCCGYGLVVRCLILFFFLWVWWLWWWIGDYDGGLIFYFVRGFGCVWWWWWYRWLWVWLWLWLMVEVVEVGAGLFFWVV